MKTLLTCFLFFVFIFASSAQQLNKYGHFLVPPENGNIPQSVLSKLDKQVGDESTVTKIYDGYLILKNSCEGGAMEIVSMSGNGTVRFSRMMTNVLSTSFSFQKKYMCIATFHDLIVVNLITNHIEVFPPSTLFAVNDLGEVAAYREDEGIVSFDNHLVQTNERILGIRFFRDEPYFISMTCLYKLNSSLFPVKCFNQGRIFEAKQIGDKMYVSTKKETGNEFIFKSYVSNDMSIFISGEETHLPLDRNVSRIRSSQGVNQSAVVGEAIRCPLQFYPDTIYQPVGNSYGENQDYGTNTPYLHPGVDLMGTYLQQVRSVKKGYVKAVLTTSGTAHWRIAIANDNTAGQSSGYLYAHLEELLIPYAVGDSVDEGNVIGQLVDFPVQGFVHCHFARILDSGATWFGAWWTYQNPLASMTNFYDSVPPVFELTDGAYPFAFRDTTGNDINWDSLYGKIKIIAKFYDIINSSWHVDVNTIRYNLSPDFAPDSLIFDTASYQFNFYTDEYGSGMYTTEVLNTIYCRDSGYYSVGNYVDRNFYHVITNTDGNDTIDGNDSIQYFNTRLFPNGGYILRVTATDPSGNSATDSMYIQIKNLTTGIDAQDQQSFNVYPNPAFSELITIDFLQDNLEKSVEVTNDIGQLIYREDVAGSVKSQYLKLKEKGIYFLRVKSGGREWVKRVVRE